jgi:hypothetical protein
MANEKGKMIGYSRKNISIDKTGIVIFSIAIKSPAIRLDNCPVKVAWLSTILKSFMQLFSFLPTDNL